MHRRFIMVLQVCLLLVLLTGALFLPQSSVYAAPIITVTPITWNIVGLDSNDPLNGPSHFPVGASVCISGYSSFPVTVTSTFEWDNSTNASVIKLRDNTLSSVSLTFTGNGCKDAYFEVEVTQASSSFDKTRRYHITATDGSVTASTPQPRELYVEHLISQSRNGIRSVELNGSTILPGGTMYLQVGGTYDITLRGFTATQGYNQFEDFINLPNIVFRVNSVVTTYASNNSPYVPGPSPVTNPALYADACLWENDPGSPNYRSCIGGDYKSGGDPVSTVYNVTILPSSVTSGTLKTLLYDFSGSSYHYNADFGISYYFQIIDPTQVTINKAFNPRSYNSDSVSYSTMTITLSNPTGITATGLQFVDVFPTTPGNMTVYSTPNVTNTCGGTVYNSNAGTNAVAAGDPGIKLVGGTLAPYGTCTITVNVTVPSNGNYENETQNLFVNVNGVSTNTNKIGEDTLRVSSLTPPTALCGSPTTLATWNFNNSTAGTSIVAGTAIPADSTGGTATNANAYYTAGTGSSSAYVMSTNFAPLPVGPDSNLDQESWGISNGWLVSGTPTGTTAPSFEFQVNAGDYSFLNLSARANMNGSWSNGDSWYVFRSTDGGWSSAAVGTGTWDTPGYRNTWGSITMTPDAANSGSTYFRVMFVGSQANKTNDSIFLDNVTITGCAGTPPPNFSKSFSPDSIKQGETSTLTFTINNNATGNQALTGISFTDTLPTGLTLSSGTASCGGTNNVTITAPRTISMAGGSLAAGASCTFNVTVTGSTVGHHNNITSYLSTTETGTSTQYAEDAIDVVAPPVVSKVFGPNPIVTNGASQLTFTITNPNPSASLSNIAFTDNSVSGWPSGLAVDSPNGLTGSCGGGTVTAVEGSTSVSLSGATLAAGASCTFSLNVRATSAGTKTNTTSAVTATSSGLSLTGTAASATLTVNSPMSLIGLNKQVSTDNTNWFKYVGLIPSPTQNVWYKFTISNDGETTLNGISVTDSGYNMTGCTWPATLAVGASASCVLGPIPVAAAPTPNPFINTATVTTTTYTPSTPVTSQAKYGTESLAITKNATESYFIAAGDVLHYSFTVSNNGGYPLASPVTVTDDKIGLVSCQDATLVGDFDSYLDPGESVACPATGTVSYTVLSDDVSAKAVTNTAHGSAGGVDSPNVVKTIPLAALTIDKDTTTPSIDANGNLVYTIVVVNAGQADLTNFQVSDVLPAFGGTSAVLSVTAPGYTVNGSYTGTAPNTNLLTGTDTLAASATAAITITVDLNNAAVGTYDNTATVTTTQTGIIDDDGLTAGDAGTPSLAADPETDEDIVIYLTPDLTVTKTNNTANGWTTSGGTFQWTITARNGAAAGTASFANGDVILSDTLPAGQTYGALSVTNGTTAPTGTIDCSITGTTLSCVANGSVTLPADASFSVAFNVTTAGSANLVNTATVDPGSKVPESNEGNNTGSNTTYIFDAQPSKLLVTTSEPATSGSRVAIGEMVRYRIAARIPEGDFANFQLVDNIPSGLQFVDDGTAMFSFVSNGAGVTSSTLTCTDDTGNAFDLTSLSTANVDCSLAGAISGGTGNGVPVTFSLGNLSNADLDADAEYAVVEFNALVLNVNSSATINQGTDNQNGDNVVNNRQNDLTLKVNNTTVGSNSTNVTVNIAEPGIVNMVKSVSAGPYLPGGAITYTLTFSNVPSSQTNATTAFDIVLTDGLDANLTPDAVNVSSSQTSPCTGGTAFSTSTLTSGQNVTANLSCLDPGKTVTITINATIKAATTSGTNISNTGTMTYSSLPGEQGTCATAPFTCTGVGGTGSGTGERNGSGGLGPDAGAGAVLNNYADTGTAGFTVQAGTITIEKQTLPDGSTQNFTFTPTYNGGTSFNLTDNGTNTSGNLAPGTYTVVESAVAGWTLTGLSCVGDTDNGSTLTLGTGTAQIDLDSGENITCTFTSTKLPILTLQKTVVNDNGGSALDTAWTLTATQGVTTISGVEGDAAITDAVVTTGTWTLSESGGPTGYTPGTWSCNGAADVNPNDGLTLAAGEDVSCSITNDDNAATPTITAVDDSATTPVNTAVTTTVTTNDTNVGGSINPNSVSVTVQPPAGTGTVACAVDSCQYTPPTGYVGTTTYTYQVCLAAPNGAICDTAVVTVTVTPTINAVDDDFSASPVNGGDGGTTASVIGNDTTNGAAAVIGTNVSLTPGIAPTPTAGSIAMNADGTITVAAGTTAGTYNYPYMICTDPATTPATCDPATATIVVTAPTITANDDTATTPANTPVTTVVITNDTNVGGTINPNSVTVTVPPATGSVVCTGASCQYTPPAGFVGTVTYTYRVCLAAPNGSICDTAVVTVNVTPTIDAVNDNFSATPINGGDGGTTASVIDNDTTNSVAAVIGTNVTLTPGAAPAPASGSLTMNANGTITVAAGTTPGTYTYPYTICTDPATTPDTCDTASATVVVAAPTITANDDTATTTANTPVTTIVTSNDTNVGGSINQNSVTVTIPPATGSVVCSGASCLYTSPAGFVGTVTYTYQVCLAAPNGSVCDTAVVTVNVTPTITAVDDNYGPINGFSGGTTASVIGNDTTNGEAAVIGTNVTLTPGSAPTPTAGSITMNTDGTITVAAGTTAGTYNYPYTICTDPATTPATCDTATATVVVSAAPILAVDDSAGPINGLTGATNVLNVFSNDTLNGVLVNPVDVTLTRQPGGDVELTLNPDGSVDVAAGTPAGTYTFDYQICENLNPTNCSIATVTVTVNAAPILAVDDGAGPVNGLTGATNVLNVFSNDTLNGLAVNPADVTLTRQPGGDAELILNPNGSVDVAAGTPANTYTFDYQICENLNPTNCSIATVTVTVVTPAIDAVDDNFGPVSGFTGGTTATVLTNDTLNGGAVSVGASGNVILTLGAAPTPTLGSLTMNADGTITVAAGTTAGTYNYPYTICDVLNPTNCDTATATVVVSAAPIDAVDNSFGPINGLIGSTTATVLTNDTLNGGAVAVGAGGNVTLTPGTAPTPAAGSITMNADGTITVAASTTAGTFTYPYTICEVLNPANCDNATATVTVNSPAIDAVNDDFSGTPINGGAGGNAGNAFSNDTLNGVAVLPAQITASIITAASNPGVTLNLVSGSVDVSAGTPAGTYTITYQICDDLNPTNCDTAIITVEVNSPAIGIAKRIVSNTEVAPGLYEITYELNVKNFSAVALNSIQVTDDLRATFPAPIVFTVQSATSTDFTVSGTYSGSAPNINLLSGTNSLAANASGTITLIIRVTPTSSGPFSNTAIASGQCAACVTPVTDQSQTGTNPDPDGDNDPTDNNDPTVVSFGPNLFDPPFGMKVFDASGLPLLQWTMVWINDSNIVAINARVNDPLAAGTTFAGGLVCTPSGSSTTTLCTYDAASNSVIWSGNIGPDLGATDAASAANEVTITFNVNVASGVRSVRNIATVDSDLNGNALLTDPGEQTVASATSTWTAGSTTSSLPATGFAPNVVTNMRPQPNDLMYADTDLILEIPSLGIKLPIVGVSKKNGTWDVSWLSNQAGWLEGTAFPSWNGNSVLTSHVYLSNGLPGPFVNLGKLKYGDKIVVHAYGETYTFEVRENKIVEPDDRTVMKHEEKSWLTLITCKEYDPVTNTYRKRLVVRAVLVKVDRK